MPFPSYLLALEEHATRSSILARTSEIFALFAAGWPVSKTASELCRMDPRAAIGYQYVTQTPESP